MTTKCISLICTALLMFAQIGSTFAADMPGAYQPPRIETPRTQPPAKRQPSCVNTHMKFKNFTRIFSTVRLTSGVRYDCSECLDKAQAGTLNTAMKGVVNYVYIATQSTVCLPPGRYWVCNSRSHRGGFIEIVVRKRDLISLETEDARQPGRLPS